eukprot:1021329-Amphidinium_carterae.1
MKEGNPTPTPIRIAWGGMGAPMERSKGSSQIQVSFSCCAAGEVTDLPLGVQMQRHISFRSRPRNQSRPRK